MPLAANNVDNSACNSLDQFISKRKTNQGAVLKYCCYVKLQMQVITLAAGGGRIIRYSYCQHSFGVPIVHSLPPSPPRKEFILTPKRFIFIIMFCALILQLFRMRFTVPRGYWLSMLCLQLPLIATGLCDIRQEPTLTLPLSLLQDVRLEPQLNCY